MFSPDAALTLSSETQGQLVGSGEKAGRKSVFKYEQKKSPWVPTLTEPFPKI